jgi:hypothetical protein
VRAWGGDGREGLRKPLGFASTFPAFGESEFTEPAQRLSRELSADRSAIAILGSRECHFASRIICFYVSQQFPE